MFDAYQFSTVTAISELVVTSLVLYVIISALRGGPLKWQLLFGVLAFELLVNVAYMVSRTVTIAQATPVIEPGHWVTLLGAFHGILSLLMFVGLVTLSILAYRHHKQGMNFFQNYSTLTYTFIGLWLISVISGEVLYFAVWY